MKDLQNIDNNNSLAVINFDLQITSDELVYVSQKLRKKLSFFQGEWYLDIEAGLPYYQSILQKIPNLDYVADLYKTKILSLPEINELLTFDIALTSDRKLQLAFSLKLSSGNVLEMSEVI